MVFRCRVCVRGDARGLHNAAGDMYSTLPGRGNLVIGGNLVVFIIPKPVYRGGDAQ